MSSANAPEPVPQPVTGRARIKSALPSPLVRGASTMLRFTPQWLGGRLGQPGPVDLQDPRWHNRPQPAAAPTRVIIGPANFAGQGYAWCRALEASGSDVSGISFQVEAGGPLVFPVDFKVPSKVHRRNTPWETDHFEWVVDSFTHAFIEAGRPMFGDLLGLSVFKEHDALTARGLTVGMISHGSDSRSPERHANQYSWSPYRDTDWEETEVLRNKVRLFAPKLADYEGSVLVSTPDLLDDVPSATWLPVVVDEVEWPVQPLLDRTVPVVVHAASHSRIKGTRDVKRQLAPLEKARHVRFELLEQVAPATVRESFARADIVLDQFRLGSYGVAAVEAMMSGRVVVGNVVESVRERVRSTTGEELPIVQADPDQIGAVVRDLISDPDRVESLGASSAAFARTVHGGALSAAVLRDAMGVATHD